MSELLEVKNLSVSFNTAHGQLQAVRDVTFSLKKGEVLAIVGESGCGKSVLCKSIMKLLPDYAHISSGTISVDGTDITDYSQRDMKKLRGKVFSMIFQNSATSLNPTVRIGRQIAEAVRIHSSKMSADSVKKRVVELMRTVGIDYPEQRYMQYPHQLSVGMRQRCVLAIALASEPMILFADEPTASLDVTVSARILELIKNIVKTSATSMVLVTHDLGVVAGMADRVAVMYAGKIVEIGTADEIFYDPRHPYTWALMRSLPYYAQRGKELYTLPGIPPTLTEIPAGDAFACRNEYALEIDYKEMPPMFCVSDTHYAATWLLDDRAPEVTPPIGGGIRE